MDMKVEYDIVPKLNFIKMLVQNCYDWADPACLFTERFLNFFWQKMILDNCALILLFCILEIFPFVFANELLANTESLNILSNNESAKFFDSNEPYFIPSFIRQFANPHNPKSDVTII